MRIKRKFLQLTKKTYPFGTERQLLQYLPEGYQTDSVGNFYIQIGENPTTMFACHLDTACSTQKQVRHVIDGNFIKTDGKSILGADDKAGMCVVLYMIENKVPGLYYFFLGEEVGCVGSTSIAKNWKFKNIKKCVSFDRRGTGSVITEQFWGRCCSDEFAIALSKEFNGSGCGLNYRPDNTGIITDSAQFIELIPECTNISVGYYKEHTGEESQDMDHLVKLCKSVVKINWEDLPIVRSTVTNFVSETEFEEFYFGDRKKSNQSGSRSIWIYLHEEDNYIECRLKKHRLEAEKSLIYNWVYQNPDYWSASGISWDGSDCYIWYDSDKQFLGCRSTLVEVCPELGDVTRKDVEEEYVF